MASKDVRADWHLLLLFALVLAVGITGLLMTGQAEETAGATGRVVDDPCRCSPGLPVCAVRDGVAFDYASECLAVCEGARVLADGRCSSIRHVGT